MLKWLTGAKGGNGARGNWAARLDHPLLDANEAQRVADGLSAAAPEKALADASLWLVSISKAAGLRRHQRFELISMLDAAICKAQTRMTDRYVTLLESGGNEEKRIRQTAGDFCGLLTDGYWSCARPSSDHMDIPPEFKPLLPLLSVRGLRALRCEMKWVSMRYGAVRSGIWQQYGRFLTLAESVDAAATPVSIFHAVHPPVSPLDEFVRGMMFWSILPGALSPVEQDIAERLIVHLTAKFHCSVRPADNCDYFFDVDGARPPLRFVRSAPVSAATRYLDVDEARRALRAMQSLAGSAGSLPSGVDCGPAAEVNVILRVLKHLGVNLASELPSRASGRRKAGVRRKSVYGFERVLAVVMHGGLDAPGLLTQGQVQSWGIDDTSAGGCGVTLPSNQSEHLQVGVLVAVQRQGETAGAGRDADHTTTAYQVGVIRRVSDDGAGQYHIGIQWIAPAAVPVHLRSLAGAKQGRNRECAILLSIQPSSSGNLYVVARRDLFSGREPVEAVFGVSEATVILQPGGVVESGKDFDWLRYKAPMPAL